MEDIITYEIDSASYENHLTNVVKNLTDLLTLDPETGEISLISYVPTNMEGYMMFNVIATDLMDHRDITAVKIFIVSESNRVKFVFLTDIQVIRKQDKFVSRKVDLAYFNGKARSRGC